MKFILERKNYGTLYHFTPLINLYLMVIDNEIISDKTLDDLYQDNIDAEKRIKTLENKYEFYISTTRNKNLYKKNHGILNFLSCRISLDTDKLTDHYKVIPVNYFNTISYSNDEDEEAILLTKGQHKIDFNKYVSTVSLPSYNLFLQEILSYKEDYKYMYHMLIDMVIPKINLGRNNTHVANLLKSSIKECVDKEGVVKDVYDALINFIKNKIHDKVNTNYIH